MTDMEISYNWNGEVIDLNLWADCPSGEFEYQTRNRRHSFRFFIEPAGNIMRIYILEAPSYGGRAIDGHSTHRHYDTSERRHYVCIRQDLQPETMPEALSWMIYWAEETGHYIDSGSAFS